MEEHTTEDFDYKSAKKKVKKIKGFYIHLLVYIFVNIAFFAVEIRQKGFEDAMTDIWNYRSAFLWGIGIFAHWASTFGIHIFFGKDWEERKVEKLMKQKKKRTWE